MPFLEYLFFYNVKEILRPWTDSSLLDVTFTFQTCEWKKLSVSSCPVCILIPRGCQLVSNSNTRHTSLSEVETLVNSVMTSCAMHWDFSRVLFSATCKLIQPQQDQSRCHVQSQLGPIFHTFLKLHTLLPLTWVHDLQSKGIPTRNAPPPVETCVS